MQALLTVAAQRNYPNVAAQAHALAASAEEEAALQQHARACVRPGIDYFLQKFNLQFYKDERAFKDARYACPMRFQEFQPAPAELDALRSFPFLDDNETIAILQRELPLYRAEAEGIWLEDGQQMAWFQSFGSPATLVPNSKTAIFCPACFGSRTACVLATQSQFQ